MKHPLTIFLAALLLLTGCSQKNVSDRDHVVVAYVTSWTDVMPDPARITHINYAFGHVNRTFDGVRIDNEDRLRALTDLKTGSKELKVCLSIGGWGSGKDKILTLATVCSAEYIDFPAIMPSVDFVNIMSYDMGWAPMHNAPLYRTDKDGNVSPIAGGHTADEAVKAHLKAGVPAERLVMGMPMYERGDQATYGDFTDYRELDGQSFD